MLQILHHTSSQNFNKRETKGQSKPRGVGKVPLHLGAQYGWVPIRPNLVISKLEFIKSFSKSLFNLLLILLAVNWKLGQFNLVFFLPEF